MAASSPRVVLDASAAIALLRAEPTAPHVERLLRDAVRTRMATVNAAETVDVLIRVYRRAPDAVVAAIEQLLASVEPVPPSLEVATRAGELRARHFRRDRRLSLADCFCLATAEPGDAIVTTDGPLASAARDEGIEVDLIDSRST